MSDEDKTFSGSFVLDLRIWWRQTHTLYTKSIPSSFRGLKVAFSHKALHTIQLSNEVLVQCEKNGGWRSVFDFRGENLTVLCYFYSGFYTIRRQIDGKIRYVGIFLLFDKNMSLISIKSALIWWYFCFGPRLRRLVQGFWKCFVLFYETSVLSLLLSKPAQWEGARTGLRSYARCSTLPYPERPER